MSTDQGSDDGQPGYDISATVSEHNVKIEYNGVTVVDSDRAVLYRESRMPAVYYFPRDDVRMDLMQRSRTRTHCPFKGNASYWSLTVGDKLVEDAVWSYEKPLPESDGIKGYLAFYLSKLGVSYNEDGQYEDHHSKTDSHGSSFMDWLLREAWSTKTPGELTQKLGQLMSDNNMSVARMSVFIRTLHPLLIGSAYVWRPDKDDVHSFVLTHDTLSSPLFLDSPLIPIFNGAGGIRRRLEGESPLLDYGIIKQLHEEGMTDYAAMPMTFSNGQINALTMSTGKEGGFTTAELGRVHEILPLLSRLFEVHAAHSMCSTLMQTYLGRSTGDNVLKGLIKRGDSENLHAVIWFCDLRGSTPLAESMPPEEFIAVLNQFFECMVKPVVDHGGEVLRFIGDAVLAVFPLLDGDSVYQRACDDALAAAADAEERLLELNRNRAEDGKVELDYGIGLHVGHMTYGNIGIPERLEFTVIGAAANEAARIESLTKEVDARVVVSSTFANHCSSPLLPLGEFELRGVSEKQTIYVPDEAPGY
jgi:adenylate cyclase